MAHSKDIILYKTSESNHMPTQPTPVLGKAQNAKVYSAQHVEPLEWPCLPTYPHTNYEPSTPTCLCLGGEEECYLAGTSYNWCVKECKIYQGRIVYLEFPPGVEFAHLIHGLV